MAYLIEQSSNDILDKGATIPEKEMAHPARFERATSAFGGQLYGVLWLSVFDKKSIKSMIFIKLVSVSFPWIDC